jgi:hypothetical protein
VENVRTPEDREGERVNMKGMEMTRENREETREERSEEGDSEEK